MYNQFTPLIIGKILLENKSKYAQMFQYNINEECNTQISNVFTTIYNTVNPILQGWTTLYTHKSDRCSLVVHFIVISNDVC